MRDERRYFLLSLELVLGVAFPNVTLVNQCKSSPDIYICWLLMSRVS